MLPSFSGRMANKGSDLTVTLRSAHLIAALLVFAGVLVLYTIGDLPVMGVSDNGDFGRIFPTFGLSHKAPLQIYRGWHFEYVDHVYTLQPVPGQGIGPVVYGTSELPLVWLAVTLRQLWPGTDFDVRWMGFIHGVLLFAAVGVFVSALRLGRFKSQAILSIVCLIVLFDGSYLSFANSFYSEPALLIGFLLFAGTAIRVYERRALTGSSLLVLTLSGVMAASSKSQTITLAPLLAVATLALALRLARQRRLLAGALVSASLQVAVPVACLALTSPIFRRANQFNVVFLELLKHTPDQNEAMDSLGLSRDLLKYVGGDVWTVGQATDLEQKFYPRVSWGRIVRYYLTHPRVTRELVADGVSQGFRLSLPLYGHHEAVAGYPPRMQATGFVVWQAVRDLISPLGLILIPLAFFGSVWIAWSQPQPDRIWYAAVSGWLVVAGCLQFATALVGEGRIDVVKHMLPFNLCFDVLLLWTLYCFLRLRDTDGTEEALLLDTRVLPQHEPESVPDEVAVRGRITA